MKYQIPSQLDVNRFIVEARLRRRALSESGCQTYAVGYRAGKEAIQCLCCGLGSANPNDLLHKYCGFCHQYHSGWSEANLEQLGEVSDRI